MSNFRELRSEASEQVNETNELFTLADPVAVDETPLYTSELELLYVMVARLTHVHLL